MTQYWCVNFDSEECMAHGIKHNLWLMQYQYKDDLGNEFQGGSQKAATTANWKRLTRIKAGDWMVAYLPRSRTSTGNAFFAMGQVRPPRKPATSNDHNKTVAEYVKDRKSHEYKTGVLHYPDAPIFYEDFDDKWRANDSMMRYPQRIDVDEWQLYVEDGVPWLSGLKLPPFEIQKAFFKVKKNFFDRITKALATSGGRQGKKRARSDDTGEVQDNAVVDALEKSHAKSQGFLLDSKLRKALENFSMDEARHYFTSLGYSVEDHSKNHPYDLKCTRSDDTLYVEVKGTQTDGKEIILTNGEVEFARRHLEQMALFLLHSIEVSKNRKVVSNGTEVVLVPWDVEQGVLTPLSYKCKLPSNGNRKR